VLDYYFCAMTQLPDDKFSSDITSDACPVVGSCGHSFARGNVVNWCNAQQLNRKLMPCPFKCSRQKKDALGILQLEPLKPFRMDKLVPNYSLCEAIHDIDSLKSKLKEARTPRQKERILEQAPELAHFQNCLNCNNEFSTESKNGDGDRPPHAAIVGVCGHTYCLTCIYDMHAAALSRSRSSTLKHFSCDACLEEKAFHSERLFENIGLRNALLYWNALRQGRIDLQADEEETLTRWRASEEAAPVRVKRESPCSEWTIQETENRIAPTQEKRPALVAVKREEEEADVWYNSSDHSNRYDGESVNDEKGTEGEQPKEEELEEGVHARHEESDGKRVTDNNQHSGIHGSFTEEDASHRPKFSSAKCSVDWECISDEMEEAAACGDDETDYKHDRHAAEASHGKGEQHREDLRKANKSRDHDAFKESPQDSSNEVICLVYSSDEESSAEPCTGDVGRDTDQENVHEVNDPNEKIPFNHGQSQEPNREQERKLAQLLKLNELLFLCLNEFDAKLRWGIYDRRNHLICIVPGFFLEKFLGERRYDREKLSSTSSQFLALRYHVGDGRRSWQVQTWDGNDRTVPDEYVQGTFRCEFVERAEAHRNEWLTIPSECRGFPRIELANAKRSNKDPVIKYRFEQESRDWKLIYGFASAVHEMGLPEEAQAIFDNMRSSPSDESQIDRLHEAVARYLQDYQLLHAVGGDRLQHEVSRHKGQLRVFRPELPGLPSLTCFVVVYKELIFEPVSESALPAVTCNLGYCCACPDQTFAVKESWTLIEKQPTRKRPRPGGHCHTNTEPHEVLEIDD
jgi:RING-type zinc-finger